MPGCDDGLERERSEGPSKSGARCATVQIPSIELVPPRARRCTTMNVVFYSLCLFFFVTIILLVIEHRLRERANRATSGANGANESERSDGPNKRSVRSDGWMERMERVAPPFRCVLSSSSCRRAGGGVTMWNLCLRQTLRAPANIFPFFDQGYGRGGTPVFTGVFEPLARVTLYLTDGNDLGS